MSVDQDTVKRIARLARIAVNEEDVPALAKDLNAILDFVEQLDELDTGNVEPMTSAVHMTMKKRTDEVTDGGYAERITANAPESEDGYFVVPKVVE